MWKSFAALGEWWPVQKKLAVVANFVCPNTVHHKTSPNIKQQQPELPPRFPSQETAIRAAPKVKGRLERGYQLDP